MRFETVTPVQELTIPIILKGQDIIACAQTGTGKTAAYLLPVLDKLVRNGHNGTNALILVPTRELAIQIDQQMAGFGYFLDVASTAIYGGNDKAEWERQKTALTSVITSYSIHYTKLYDCLVVTPLIALMKDQVSNLKSRGIKALSIHSGMTGDEISVALNNCVYGGVKFLYLSPERLITDLFVSKLPHLNINLLAIDEAHCISQWGYDFRPSYLKVAEVRNNFV